MREKLNERIYTVEEIKKALSTVLKNEPVYEVILFGSYAKGKANQYSDIDLLIDTNSQLKGFSLIELILKIQDALKKDIDGFEKYEIIENSNIDNEIRKTGIVVYKK